MPLHRDDEEHLVMLTTDLLLEVRKMYLAAGASPLKHWDQMSDRLRSATRTCSTPAAWITKLLRDLQISAPNSALSASLDALCMAVSLTGPRAWVAIVEREHAYIFARARRVSEERRDARTAAANALNPQD